MEKTYLFYDIETTGLNFCFDQVLQFAAIRTNLNLKELERYEINVKLNCDIVPTPAAILTHLIGINQSQSGISEYSAICQIHQLLNTPGTISIGYNSLGFDDEFLRFSFYRNLLPPYTHQFANHCSRTDLYPMTVLFYLFKPEILAHWPEYNQQVSLKLELLSQANQLASGQAHTAMVDVLATLKLAQIFYQDREMWDYLTGCFDKNVDLTRAAQLSSGLTIEQQPYQEALLINGKFGAKCNFLAPVLHLGQHTQYKNQNLWLRLDSENIAEQPYVVRRKAGENELLLPVKPRYLEKISTDRQQLVTRNKLWLREHPAELQAISAYHRQYVYPKVPDLDLDAALYELGFPSREEEMLMQKFHQAAPAKKMSIAGQFPNPIRREQALRMMGRHFFNDLTPEQQTLFKEYLHRSIQPPADQALIDYRGQRKLTLPTARNDLQTLQTTTLSPRQHSLLTELKEYYG
jgi:exodeoxyribonuclease I